MQTRTWCCFYGANPRACKVSLSFFMPALSWLLSFIDYEFQLCIILIFGDYDIASFGDAVRKQ